MAMRWPARPPPPRLVPLEPTPEPSSARKLAILIVLIGLLVVVVLVWGRVS